MDLFSKCHNFTRAKEIQAAGIYPYFIPISKSKGTEVEIDGRRVLMIGSNNYLGLTHHPHVAEATVKAVERYGSSPTGSRFLNGTLELHEELERRLAKFLRRESALVFSTGFQTNLGVISALCGKDDVVLIDRDDHASIVDGCRLSFAEIRKFRHNDMADLERHLQRAEAEGYQGKLIIVDGAYSMLGNLADLVTITRLAKHYNSRVLVDEAHSIGVCGAHGRGAAEALGVEKDVDLIVGTFSKSFASLGGFVAGPETVIHYVKHHARSLIFSAAIPASAAAAALAALDVLESEPQLRTTLMRNAHKMRDGLKQLGFRVGPSETAIVPVIIGDQTRMFLFWKALFEGGAFTNPVTIPAVPLGMDLIRTSYMATHTDSQLDQALEIFENAGRRMGLIGGGATYAGAREQFG